MTMRISRDGLLKQSRLAGFFLCSMLFGCSEPQPVVMNLTLQQAQLAEQKGLVSQALPLYQKAAANGESLAVAAVLRLQRPEGHLSALTQWLESLPLTEEQRLPFSAELGLWQQFTPEQALRFQQQWQSAVDSTQQDPQPWRAAPVGQRSSPSCALYLQPVLSTRQSSVQWQHLLQQWQQDPQLSGLALCFRQPVFVDSQLLACSEQRTERIVCNAQALMEVVRQGTASQILVLAGRGGASYNNGWLQLPETATLPLLRHELSHLFGFIDEYPLSQAIAMAECVPGRITPNLLFSKDDLPTYLSRWQLVASDVQLTAVTSCQHSKVQAYRVVAADSHLQHYELAMPALYLKLIRQQLKQPEQLMPVAYYFAYLARQQQDWQAWQQMMELAAAFGYPPARQALVEAGGNSSRKTVR